MPYSNIKDLPKNTKKLPKHAKEIFKEAFNHAWEEYDKDEVRCQRVAWGAVKKKYKKEEDKWVKK